MVTPSSREKWSDMPKLTMTVLKIRPQLGRFLRPKILRTVSWAKIKKNWQNRVCPTNWITSLFIDKKCRLAKHLHKVSRGSNKSKKNRLCCHKWTSRHYERVLPKWNMLILNKKEEHRWRSTKLQWQHSELLLGRKKKPPVLKCQSIIRILITQLK